MGQDFYTWLVANWLFPLHERLKGHQTVALLAELERTQWLSPSELEMLRLSRLREFLDRVGRYVPYYRCLFGTLGFDPARITDLTDLQVLPVTDKSFIQAHRHELVSEIAEPLGEYRTSGSTGELLSFLMSKARVGHDVAAKWRATRWWGLDIGDPEIVVWGSPIEVRIQDRWRQWRDRLLRSYLLPIREISTDQMDYYLAKIRRIRPKMLFGYPSALARLAWRARETKVDMADSGIRVAFVTSEVLQPMWRQVIAEVFGCSVANEYGARDAGFLARECPNGGLHITADDLIIEILDSQGQSVPVGQSGEVVVTHLFSSEFPFIRYRTGDIAALNASACSCGRGLPLIKDIQGRANEYLVATNESLIHGSSFNYIIRSVDGIKAYKIIQESLKIVHVFLVVNPDFQDNSISMIKSDFQNILGSSVNIMVEKVTDIPSEISGKFRHIICKLLNET